MNPIVTTEAIPATQIAEWKEKFKNIFCIGVPASDEEGADIINGYFRKPSIDELGMATAANKDNMLKASRTIYNTCFLGGHPDFQKNDDVVMSALNKFSEITKVREAEIKKL